MEKVIKETLNVRITTFCFCFIKQLRGQIQILEFYCRSCGGDSRVLFIFIFQCGDLSQVLQMYGVYI